MGAVNVPWLFAANAIAPPLATDALKATDTFPPSFITAMPASRINVDACSGLSGLRWDCKTQRICSRLLKSFSSFLKVALKLLLATHRGDRLRYEVIKLWKINDKSSAPACVCIAKNPYGISSDLTRIGKGPKKQFLVAV